MNALTRTFTVDGADFSRAGEASAQIKSLLKALGMDPDVTRRASVSAYEAEINMVIHADGGQILLTVTPEAIDMVFEDTGPGIPDVKLAMQEGWSTAPRDVVALGFGAGMGLPNIYKYSDEFQLDTTVNVGTTLKIRFFTGKAAVYNHVQ